jgi:hypothetical protein
VKTESSQRNRCVRWVFLHLVLFVLYVRISFPFSRLPCKQDTACRQELYTCDNPVTLPAINSEERYSRNQKFTDHNNADNTQSTLASQPVKFNSDGGGKCISFIFHNDRIHKQSIFDRES